MQDINEMAGKEQFQAVEDIVDAMRKEQQQTLKYVTERTVSVRGEQKEQNPGLNVAYGKGKVVAAPDARSAPSVGQTPWLAQGARALDPKRLKRLSDNRQSNVKSRIKKEQKRIELEDKCNKYTTDVRVLPIMIQHYYDRRETLKKENDDLRRNFFTVMQKKHVTEAQAEILRRDIEWLTQLKTQQYQQHMLIDQISQQQGLLVNQESRQQSLQVNSLQQRLLTSQNSQQLGLLIEQGSQQQRLVAGQSLQQDLVINKLQDQSLATQDQNESLLIISKGIGTWKTPGRY